MNTREIADTDSPRPISNGVKKLIAPAILAFILPALALAAAYNDVSLDGNVVLSVGGITVNVSSATLNEITVDSTTFAVTIAPGSTIRVTAPNLNQLSVGSNGTAFLAANRCDGSESSFTMTAAASDATTTVTVTPSSTLCTTASSGSSGTGSGSGGGGGGGGGGGSTILPSTATTPAPTPTPTPTPTATPAPATTASGAQSQQILALVAQLRSLIALLEKLGGTVSPQTKALLNAFPAPASSFARDLEVGAKGEDVKVLQVYLNTHGYAVAANGAGSSGNETTTFGRATRAALVAFQKAVGISPASGYFGPKTRFYVNAHP